MNVSHELQPCPFCGREALAVPAYTRAQLEAAWRQTGVVWPFFQDFIASLEAPAKMPEERVEVHFNKGKTDQFELWVDGRIIHTSSDSKLIHLAATAKIAELEEASKP
jgi:hypothetical protein